MKYNLSLTKLPYYIPNIRQKEEEWINVGPKGKALIKKSDPIQSGSGLQPLVNPISAGGELPNKLENVCYFYKIGKCRFGKEICVSIANLIILL